jgi:thioredoxin reductase (NADPH)
MFDIIIAGSGPAGLTAAIYAARANKKVGVVLGNSPGGQLTKTNDVENFPGFAEPIKGPKLMDEMIQQAKNCSAELIAGSVASFEKKTNFEVVLSGNSKLHAKALIIATGAEAKLLGIEGEFWGAGISACATCDGFFFKNQTVAVVGGGSAALEEAIYLSGIAKKVYIIHRRTAFRGEIILQERIKTKQNIEILWPYSIKEFFGVESPKMLKGVVLQHSQTLETLRLNLDGLFVAIGHQPNTAFLRGILDLDENGYIIDQITTKIPGLFVAGDAFDKTYRQAVTAAGYGCMAALDCLKWLEIQ